MSSQPRQRRSAAPADPPAPSVSISFEWRLRLALALLLVSACSVLGNLVALIALGSAIAHLGAPQGPLEFALVFIGALVGLGGDALILRGALAVVRPGTRFSGHPERVLWGLGLQLLAAALVGVLESSWLFGVVYAVILGGLAYVWSRSSPFKPAPPVARHPQPEPSEPVPAEAPGDRLPMPWVGNAPPPPSSQGMRWEEHPRRDGGGKEGGGTPRGHAL